MGSSCEIGWSYREETEFARWPLTWNYHNIVQTQTQWLGFEAVKMFFVYMPSFSGA